jgi:pyruvate/2-oxoglutarate/acetoin dehydrogenase E1 component
MWLVLRKMFLHKKSIRNQGFGSVVTNMAVQGLKKVVKFRFFFYSLLANHQLSSYSKNQTNP